ncbi:MAG: class I SAM-dependent methyltransferase [Halobacteriovoraceae bacterium]|nr:class I SAM-dependent methyltransferase [Halobacteriovoraceae bacterium]
MTILKFLTLFLLIASGVLQATNVKSNNELKQSQETCESSFIPYSEVKKIVPNIYNLQITLNESLNEIKDPIFRIIKILDSIKGIESRPSLEYEKNLIPIVSILTENFLLKSTLGYRKEIYDQKLDKQLLSIMRWIQFIDSPDMYDQPIWIKYWILKGVLTSGEFVKDIDTGLVHIHKRSKNYAGPFLTFEKFAVEEIVKAISSYPDQNIIPFKDVGILFRKVYSYVVNKYKKMIENTSDPAGLLSDFLVKQNYLLAEEILNKGLEYTQSKMRQLDYEEIRKFRKVWAAAEHGKIIQTPISSLKIISDMIHFKPGETLVDIGSGHGDPAIIFGILNPQLNIIGLELVPYKVEGANINLDYLGLKNIKFIEQDLSKNDFELPEADYYYMFNPVDIDVLESLVSQIKNKPNAKVIKVLVFSNGWTHDVLTDNGFKVINFNIKAHLKVYSL